MSRINHPSETGVAVSPSLAAIAPATPTRKSGAVGRIGIAMLAAGGGVLAVGVRGEHLHPATR